MATITIKNALINNPGAIQLLIEAIRVSLPSDVDLNIEVANADEQGTVQIKIANTPLAPTPVSSST